MSSQPDTSSDLCNSEKSNFSTYNDLNKNILKLNPTFDSVSSDNICCLCKEKYPIDRTKAYIFGESDQKLITAPSKRPKFNELTPKLVCNGCIKEYFVPLLSTPDILRSEHFLVFEDYTQTVYKLRDVGKMSYVTSCVCCKKIVKPEKVNKNKKNDNNKENISKDDEYQYKDIIFDTNDEYDMLSLEIMSENIVDTISNDIGKFDCDSVATYNKKNNQAKMFQCQICSMQINKKSRFLLHLQKHDSNPTFSKVHSCLNCKMAFKNLQDAQSHIDKKECVNNIECTAEDLNEVESNRPAVIVVEIDRVFRCEYCEKVYCEDASLLNHLNIHQGVEKPYSCNVCGLLFASYSKRISHETTHRIPRVGSVFVEIADADLQLDKFPVVKRFLCEICKKSYFDRDSLIDHKKQAHKLNSCEFKCSVCDMLFMNRWCLSRHRRKHYREMNSNFDERNHSKLILNEPSYHCSECGDSFLRSNDLRTHKRRVHTKKIDKPCPVCDKVYHRSDDLKKHIETHNTDRPFVCEICKKGFRHRNTLNEHIKIHSDERPYSCDICEMTFKRARAVKSHRLIHNKKRKYKCSHCQKFFNHPSDLKMHIQQCTVPKEEPELETESELNLNEGTKCEESVINFDDMYIRSDVVINENLIEQPINIFDSNNQELLENQADLVLVEDNQHIMDSSYLVPCGNEIFDHMSEGDYLIFNENIEDYNTIWNNFEILEDELICTTVDTDN